MSQAELARYVEQETGVAIPVRNLSKWERGDGEPSLPWIEVLSRVFDFGLPWLYGETALRYPPPRGPRIRRK